MARALLLAWLACGCSDGAGGNDAPRFVVLPAVTPDAGDPLIVAVIWPPSDRDLAVLAEPLDALTVRRVGADFSWTPRQLPPDDARLSCEGTGCGSLAEIALGLIVAIFDRDDDADVVEADEHWNVSDLVASGDDRLVGIATEHVVAFASEDVDTTAEPASLLGWPIRKGLSVMRVSRDGDRDLLVPVTARERVPIYLVGTGEAGEGLCCEPGRARDGCRQHFLCPDFLNR